MQGLPDPATLTAGGLLATAFIIGLSGAVMPGPVLAVTVTHAARQGVKAGPLVVLGHGILEAALLLALVLGLGPILTKPSVGGIVGGVGAIILLWMAFGMFKALPGMRLDLRGGKQNAAGPVRDGFLLSLANPFWSLWWATVGLSLVAMALDSPLGWWGLVILYAGHIAADLCWYLFVSLLVAKGRRFINDLSYKVLVGFCAAFMLFFGGFFALFAWQQLSAAWG